MHSSARGDPANELLLLTMIVLSEMTNLCCIMCIMKASFRNQVSLFASFHKRASFRYLVLPETMAKAVLLEACVYLMIYINLFTWQVSFPLGYQPVYMASIISARISTCLHGKYHFRSDINLFTWQVSFPLGYQPVYMASIISARISTCLHGKYHFRSDINLFTWQVSFPLGERNVINKIVINLTIK